METHNVTYYGLEIEVGGNYEEPDDDVGYGGGWSTESIKINDVEVIGYFLDVVIDEIGRMVLESNY